MFHPVCLESVSLILDFEVVQQRLVLVLAGKASVGEITVDMAPFAEAAVVEEFEFFGDDEWGKAVGKALLEHHQAAYSAVAVLEGVDALELAVEVDDVFQRLLLLGVIGLEQGGHLCMDLFRRAGFVATDFVGQAFVFAHFEPILTAVGGAGL